MRVGSPRSRGWLISGIAAFVCLALAGVDADAQGLSIEAGAGQTTFQGTPGGEWFQGVHLGARYVGPRRLWGQLAIGTPVGGSALPWAAGGAGRRFALASGETFDLGLTTGAHAYGYRAPDLDVAGWGATAEILPSLAIPLGHGLRGEIQSGVTAFTAEDDGVSFRNVLQENRLGLVMRPPNLPFLRLSGDAHYVIGSDGSYPFLGGSVTISPAERISLVADAGRWLSDDPPTTRIGVDLIARIAPGAHLTIGYAQDPGHPLYWSEPRQGWHATVSLAVGGARRSPAELLTPEVEGGRAVFRLPVRQAPSGAYIAGDFTNWERIPMQREGDSWLARIAVTSGVYHYAFSDEEGNWFVPPHLPQVDDGMGGASAVLVVP